MHEIENGYIGCRGIIGRFSDRAKAVQGVRGKRHASYDGRRRRRRRRLGERREKARGLDRVGGRERRFENETFFFFLGQGVTAQKLGGVGRTPQVGGPHFAPPTLASARGGRATAKYGYVQLRQPTSGGPHSGALQVRKLHFYQHDKTNSRRKCRASRDTEITPENISRMRWHVWIYTGRYIHVRSTPLGLSQPQFRPIPITPIPRQPRCRAPLRPHC